MSNPQTKQETAAAQAAWLGRREQGVQVGPAGELQPLYSGELVAPATGWYTIPAPVRFAAWVWAISVIVGVVAVAAGAVVWAAVLGFSLSQL